MSKSLETMRRGLRYGRLVASLEIAMHALNEAHTSADLLPDKQRAALDTLQDTVVGLLQQAWVAEEAEAQTLKAKKRGK